MHNEAFRHTRNDELQQTWTNLLIDFGIFDNGSDPVTTLRRRLVMGASEWLSGKHGSKENEKVKFGYTEKEWEWIWSLMFENRAWAVPSLRDDKGNYLKENFASEMLIRYAAHEIRCHIIILRSTTL